MDDAAESNAFDIFNEEAEHLKEDTIDALKRCLKQCAPDFVTDIPPPVKPPSVKARCYLCVADVNKMHKGPEKKKKNKNMNKHSWFCPECRLAICTKPVHRVLVMSLNKQMCKSCAEKAK